MPFLIIETCTERGLIAYGDSSHLFFEKEFPLGLKQSQYLMPFLTEALKPFGFPLILDAIGVGIGPGSYTGIRMGVAVAQTLAYAWQVPLIGLSSLDGFIPSKPTRHFTAILDARIGGLYLQKGEWKEEETDQHFPQMIDFEQIGQHLAKGSHLVTPVIQPLKTKLHLYDLEHTWTWEERAPSSHLLLKKTENNYALGQYIIPPQALDLLYLRQTEAERQAQNKSQKIFRVN